MLRQSIGTTVGIRGRRGNIFVLSRKASHEPVCYSGRDRCYLFIPKQAHLTKQSASPFPTLALFDPMWRILPVPALFRTCLYLSIRLYVSLFPSTCLTLVAAVSLFPQRSALACLPTFLFYKIDRTDETEETRSMGRNTRI